MKTKDCGFCDMLKFQKILNSATCYFETDYFAALVMKTRRKSESKYQATETTTGFELNFCPECGRAIKHRYKNPEETKAVMSFQAYYEIAKGNSWIEDKVAWALHQAWKDAEKERLKRIEEQLERKEKNNAERN